MTKALFVIFFITLSITSIISCSKDGGSGQTSVDCNTVTNKAFAANVDPIIQGSCNLAGCHAAGSTNGPGALTN